MLSAGADVNISPTCYGTMLQRAANTAHEAVVDRLLKAGADVNISAEYFGIALQATAAKGHKTIADRMPKTGADADIFLDVTASHCRQLRKINTR